jgi:hypothetical protein
LEETPCIHDDEDESKEEGGNYYLGSLSTLEVDVGG